MDMFGNFEEKQKQYKEKLKGILVMASSPDGGILVQANANRMITDIQFDPSKCDMTDKEYLQDTLIATINHALEKAEAKEKEEAQYLLKEMLPPGFENLNPNFSGIE
jgi:DNA-binding protein YbaB